MSSNYGQAEAAADTPPAAQRRQAPGPRRPGVALFALASLLGGFATDQGWLLAARVIQGIGGAHLPASAQAALANHALAYGSGRGYLVAAGIPVLAMVIALVMIRVRKPDLEGIDPVAASAG